MDVNLECGRSRNQNGGKCTVAHALEYTMAQCPSVYGIGKIHTFDLECRENNLLAEKLGTAPMKM